MGVFFLFQSILGMVTIPANLGVSNALTKRISEGEDPGEYLSTAIFVKSVLIVPVVLILYLFKEPINGYIGGDLALLLISVLLIQEAAKLMMQTLDGELRVGETASPKLLRKVLYIGVGALLVSMGFGVRGIIYGLLLGFSIMFVWGIYKMSILPAIPTIRHTRSLFNYSKYAAISSLGGYVYGWIDIAIIGYILTQSEVGVYEVAWRVAGIVMLFSNAIGTAIFPQVSQWDTDGASSRIENMLPNALIPVLYFVIPSLFGICVLSKDILQYIFGTEYAAGWIVLIILAVSKIILSIDRLFDQSLQAIDRPDLAAKASLIGILWNLLMNIVLISLFGIVGAAIATSSSLLVITTLHYYYLSDILQLELPYVTTFWYLMASSLMATSISIIKNVFIIRGVTDLFLIILLGLVLYIAITLALPTTRRQLLSIRRILSG
jgi:O-antigen/teichoic acid export membrane protein